MDLFFTGLFINLYSDNVLIGLRKESEGVYQIPQKGIFRLISCPNHFGEILEWFGFALFAASLPAWSFCLWTLFNLIPRSLAHHRWYKEQFPDYPEKRKAVIPFLL